MYNQIAYISLLISWGLILIASLDFFEIYSFDNIQIRNGLVLASVALSSLYYKINTKPITQAIKEYWNKKSKKDIGEDQDQPKTYKDYKEKED